MLSKYRKIIVYGLLLLPPLLYITLIVSFSVNIPRWDDYDVFLKYLNSSNERFDELLSQHNEHRPVFSRLTAEVIYKLFGNIDFRLLIFIGNLALFIIFYLILRKFNDSGISIKYLLPVPYLLFLSPLIENTTWATGSLQNYYVLLFSIISLIFFRKNFYLSFLLSILAAIAATYTSGAGLLVFIVLILWSIQNFFKIKSLNISDGKWILRFKRNKNAVRLFLIIIISLLISYFYFDDYTQPKEHSVLVDTVTSPLKTLEYFFVFFGSYFLINKTIALFAGLISIGMFILITYKKYYLKDPEVYYLILFLLGNGAAAAITRSGFGVEQALSSRYVIVSILTLIYLYFAILRTTNITENINKKFERIFFVLIVFVGLASFIIQVNIMSNIKNKLIKGTQKVGNSQLKLDYPDQNRAIKILRNASEKGYYRLPNP